MAYDNELRGVLFKNKDKAEGDSKPEYTGSAQIDGTDYFMDAWINTSDSGRKYMSVKFKPKQQKANPPAREPQRGGHSRDDDGPPF